MGYCVNMELGGIDIHQNNVAAALAAINALHTDEMLLKKSSGGSYGGNTASLPVRQRKCYSWVGNPPEGQDFKTLVEALQKWRYDAHEDPNGNVHVDYFSGEKWGDDEILYTAIAPFVDSGASIEIRGEDGHQWRYLFENGSYKEQSGRVSWE